MCAWNPVVIMVNTRKTRQFDSDPYNHNLHSHRNTRFVLGALAALFLGAVLPQPCLPAEGKQPQKQVLILYSFEKDVEYYSGFDETLRAGLKSGRVGPVEFHTEYLDLIRFAGRQYEKELETYLRTKYSKHKFDLVIPVSIPAIDFVLTRGEKALGKAPVVICAADRRWVSNRPRPSNMTGVVETTRINTTLGIALQLQPRTRHAYVVAGTLPYERDWMLEVQKDLHEYESKLEITYLTGLPMDELQKRLANLPENSIVLYRMMWQDGSGEYFLPREAFSRIVQSSNSPIYGVFEGFLGSGLVGGDLVSFEAMGVVVAEMGTRILGGEKPASIPIVYEDNARYMFDWRQLRRWRISEDRLPPRNEIVFKEPSSWERYRWRIIGALLLIVLQAMFIVLLVLQRRKRNRAEEEFQRAEGELRDIFEGALEGIYRTTPEGKTLMANHALAKILGYESAQEAVDLIADTGRQIWVDPEDRLRFIRLLEEQGIVRGYECQYKRKDGTRIWVSLNGRKVRGHDGRTLYCEGFIEDITERRQAMNALKRRAAFNELMTQALSRFATSPLSELDAAVEKALQAIAELSGADHAYVVRFSADRKAWSATHEWCGPNVTPRVHLFQNVPMGTTPLIENLILAGEVCRINSPDDYPPDAVAERRNQVDEGHLSVLNIPIRTKVGILGCIGVDSHAQPVVWSDDDVVHVRMVGDAVANALEHKQSMEELRRSEEKFSKAFHGSPTAMTICSVATGRYIDVNRAFERHTGYEASEVLGRTPRELGIYSHPADLERINQALLDGVRLRDVEVEYRTKAGDLRVALLSTEMIDFGGEPCRLKVVDDITDRQRAEKAMRELGARMLMVQEEERRRIARELHDDFSQRLALLAIDLEQLSQQPPATRQEWTATLQTMWSQTQELTSDVHRLSHQLHPAKLEELGLVMAVRSFCSEVSRQATVVVKFSDGNVPRFLPEGVSLCLYRIVQEALRNIVKHSGSKTATVRLNGGPGEVSLTISDSGKGFDTEEVKGGEGLGLISMYERARFAGGTLSVSRVPGGGTRVEVRIPLPSQGTVQ